MTHMTRRDFLQTSVATLAASQTSRAHARTAAISKPNVLFIMCDQLGLDAIGAHGFKDARTPNIDRLVKRGTTFMESHSTNPVCSPARSSMLTGRMPVETGVPVNGKPIHASCPNLGQWFGRSGYEAVYCGKWHLPAGYTSTIPGFIVLPAGRAAQEQGDILDTVVSRTCESYLKTRDNGKPFLLIASLLQPHDICYYGNAMPGVCRVPGQLPFPELRGRLPDLPPNFTSRPKAPATLDRSAFTRFTSPEQWRYYLYVYARMVEMLDADVGRILDALDASGQTGNTIVVFTSDHGDGRARHQHVSKWYPYDEAVKVPLIVSWPGHVAQGQYDRAHLVSGLDIMSTLCDYAGIPSPPNARGLSLRPLLEQKPVEWREYVISEFRVSGRVVRTDQYKYVQFAGDPVEQLFDMKNDPWEQVNLYEDPKRADTLEAHRKLLQEWNNLITPVV